MKIYHFFEATSGVGHKQEIGSAVGFDALEAYNAFNAHNGAPAVSEIPDYVIASEHVGPWTVSCG